MINDKTWKKNAIYLKDFKTNETVCGDYCACCWHFLCDLMMYSKVNKVTAKLAENEESIHAITIENPCERVFPNRGQQKIFL